MNLSDVGDIHTLKNIYSTHADIERDIFAV